MQLTVLAEPTCPNAPVLKDRLAVVLQDQADISVSHHVISSENAAARAASTARPCC